MTTKRDLVPHTTMTEKEVKTANDQFAKSLLKLYETTSIVNYRQDCIKLIKTAKNYTLKKVIDVELKRWIEEDYKNFVSYINESTRKTALEFVISFKNEMKYYRSIGSVANYK